MPVQTFQVIMIEFQGAGSDIPEPQSAGLLPTRAIRLVESQADQTRTFTLREERFPEHVLTTEETEQLLRLLGEMAVAAPWQPEQGLDGTDYELTLKGAMSSMTFRWWGQVPAEWWSIGEVFDYVISIADRRSSPTEVARPTAAQPGTVASGQPSQLSLKELVEEFRRRGFEISSRSDRLYYNPQLPDVRFCIGERVIRLEKRSAVGQVRPWRRVRSFSIKHETHLALRAVDSLLTAS